MKTIAIVGANGQVGTELCVTLSVMSEVRVIAICRSELSSALLRRCGIECRIGAVTGRTAAGMLSDCDVVFDLSLPRGMASEVKRSNLNLIRKALALCPPGSRYVFASTTMAFGIKEVRDKFRWRWISKTAYGANKRILEQAAISEGRKRGVPVFVLRLADVHGENQNISRQIRNSITSRRAEVPAGPSNSVFIFSIAEALIAIAEGKEKPGRYTLTSVPQWSWKDIHLYYANERGLHPEVVETAEKSAGIITRLKAVAARLLLKYREFLTGYLLVHFPRLERAAKARHLIRRAKVDIQESASVAVIRPYSRGHIGSAPGKRLSSLTDSRKTMPEVASRVRERLSTLLPTTTVMARKNAREAGSRGRP